MDPLAANRKQKTLIMVLLCLGWMVNTFDRIAINVAVIPISKEFGLTETQVGLVISSFFLSYAIMQPIGGSLADRFGSRKVILFSLITWSIFTILTGMAWSFLSLIVLRFLFGIGEGSYPSASQVSLAETFPQKERGRAKSGLLAAGKLAGVLGTLAIASLISIFDWQFMFIFLGVVGLLLAFFYWKYFYPVGTQGIQKNAPSEKMSLKQALKIPLLWQLTVIYFGISIVSWGTAAWMPSYMVKVRDLDLVSMGAVATIPAIMGLITMLFTGWLLDKYMVGREKYLIVLGALIGMISLYFFISAPSIPYVVMYGAFASIGIAIALTTTLTMPLKYIASSSIGTATGMVYLGGQLAGVIAPTVMGFMIQQFNGSYDAGFWFLISALFIALIVGMTVRTHSDETSDQATEINSRAE
ncbi:MFS transporter [Peribacillus frigoritolerans]|uniref:MFS transporter n=1 Tax=Peribacillus frigoritolerans TaxID=450367 RepID=UPI0007BEBC93|nr:MFS transporter [Peribacillus frigoritolerans]MDG4849352.1 MFS transporter [Peribacillus frigoritolerans]MED3893301.1 MFS transporter [Peribacillus frigoritolerans]QNK48914.1 MFS transporter [Brevibacterium sp. PAMC23299]